MSIAHHYVVIMAGGSGTRLWPLSRSKQPKQFLPLIGNRSLLQTITAQVTRVVPKERVFIMADAAKTALARKQLPRHPKLNFIVEPTARDNGPAIAVASLLLAQRDPEAVVAVLWSDHYIRKPTQFAAILKAAFATATKHPDHLVSIGIKPTYPATGFGYIRLGHELPATNGEPVFRVEQFAEKPDLATAEKYVADWRYLWNTGFKIFRAAQMLTLFTRHQPQDARVLKTIQQQLVGAHPSIPTADYSRLQKKDIERLITEKTKQILVIPADLGWSDVGTWNIVHDVLSEQHGTDLVVHTRGEHLSVGSKRCLVIGHQKKLIATVGLKDIIVVETADALLIADRHAAQEVKGIVEQLQAKNKHRHL